MIRNGILCAKVLALTAGLFLLNGCLLEGVDYDTVGGGSSVRGASVSDAMKASASGGGSVAGSSSHDAGTIVWRDNNDSAVGGGVAVSGGAALGDYYSEKKFAVEYDDRKYLWQVPLAVSYAVPFHGPIDSLTRFSLTLVTLETEHHYFGVFFGGDIVGMKSGSLAALGRTTTGCLNVVLIIVITSFPPVVRSTHTSSQESGSRDCTGIIAVRSLSAAM